MAAMLKGMSTLKKTLLFGSLAASSLAVSGLIYWKYFKKREDEKKSKRDEEETLLKSRFVEKSTEKTQADDSEQKQTEAGSPDLIPFAKKVVDEAVEKGVEQYQSEIFSPGGKDGVEQMEKERKDSNEAASSSGSSGQSDISFEKIGDFELQERSVTEQEPSSVSLSEVTAQTDSLPTDFSIISESKSEALQTSGGFSLIPDDSSLVRNDSPDVIVVSSDSEEQNKSSEPTSEPDVIPSPPVLVEKEESASNQDMSSSSFDVVQQTESESSPLKEFKVESDKVEEEKKTAEESESVVSQATSADLEAAGDSSSVSAVKIESEQKGQDRDQVTPDKSGAGDLSSDKDTAAPSSDIVESQSSQSVYREDEGASQSEGDNSKNTSSEDSYLSAS